MIFCPQSFCHEMSSHALLFLSDNFWSLRHFVIDCWVQWGMVIAFKITASSNYTIGTHHAFMECFKLFPLSSGFSFLTWSESRSVGGMGGTNSKQGGLLDGEGMAPLNDYLAPEAANNDAQPTTMVTSGPSDGQHAVIFFKMNHSSSEMSSRTSHWFIVLWTRTNTKTKWPPTSHRKTRISWLAHHFPGPSGTLTPLPRTTSFKKSTSPRTCSHENTPHV